MAWMEQVLVKALRLAAGALKSRATTPLADGPYADSKQLADFLELAAGQVEQGQMAALPELRRIVAPTSDWDDAGGPRELADTIDWLLCRAFRCRICIPREDESAIRTGLQKALPALRWSEGDSSWDKIRVWGERT